MNQILPKKTIIIEFKNNLRISLKKWPFSITFQVPKKTTKKQNKTEKLKNSRMGGHHEVWNQTFYPTIHDRNRKQKSWRAVTHNSYHKWGIILMGFRRLLCRMVGVRALDMLNWFYFFGKNGPYSFYHRYDILLKLSSLCVGL